ncbi:MAG: hypothetical protein K8L99_28545 [Anaerolineae bacterium]|nr:hypothetical protein [Anaerolineae bacterium]
MSYRPYKDNIHFEPMYPDVLGAITGGTRITMQDLQCAVGVYPERTFLNQPIEVVVILQNLVDQNMQIKVGIQMPKEDRKGNPIVMDIAKKILTVGLRPGEVGVLHIPMVPRPPTKAGTHLPVRVAVRYRIPGPGKPVRPQTGGAPPSILGISSFKLQALRDVSFAAHTWGQSTDIITTYFDIAPKILPALNQNIKARYESLWTYEEMETEREIVLAKVNDAYRVANGLTRHSIYDALLDAIDERFALRDLPLHPGEAQAIAKIMTYTLDEGLTLEPGFELEESRWFQTLCQLLAHDEEVEDLPRGILAVDYLFDAALYDAVLLAFGVIKPKVDEDLGNHSEQLGYANRILNWYVGQESADLSYAYLPLVMGGIVVNLMATKTDDNPWYMIDYLNEALRGRARLFTGESVAIFKITRKLLEDADDTLRRARVNRPL